MVDDKNPLFILDKDISEDGDKTSSWIILYVNDTDKKNFQLKTLNHVNWMYSSCHCLRNFVPSAPLYTSHCWNRWVSVTVTNMGGLGHIVEIDDGNRNCD